MKKKFAYQASALLATVALGVGVGTSALTSYAAENNTAKTGASSEKMMERGMLGRGKGKMKLGGFVAKEMENVDRSTEVLSNGVKEVLKGTDADSIATIQKMADRMAEMHEKRNDDANKIDLKVEKTSEGAIITRTSTDAETAASIIAQHQLMSQMKVVKDAGIDLATAVKRTVTETENGVRIEMTSDNVEVQKLLKLTEKAMPKNGMMKMGFKQGKGNPFMVESYR